MSNVEIPSHQLDQLWGVRLKRINLDAHRAGFRFDLFWTEQGRGKVAALVLKGIRYCRLEFDEFDEHEVVEFISVEAEDCELGIRLFGELSNGTFEFVCASFHVDTMQDSSAD
jgi:hypothetical protein